jgi:hypothetical protein
VRANTSARKRYFGIRDALKNVNHPNHGTENHSQHRSVCDGVDFPDHRNHVSLHGKDLHEESEFTGGQNPRCLCVLYFHHLSILFRRVLVRHRASLVLWGSIGEQSKIAMNLGGVARLTGLRAKTGGFAPLQNGFAVRRNHPANASKTPGFGRIPPRKAYGKSAMTLEPV